MNLNTPILTGWQQTAAAAYIRRHARFFRGRQDMLSSFASNYLMFFVYLPFLVVYLLLGKMSDATLFTLIVLFFLDVGVSLVLISSALEGAERFEHRETK